MAFISLFTRPELELPEDCATLELSGAVRI